MLNVVPVERVQSLTGSQSPTRLCDEVCTVVLGDIEREEGIQCDTGLFF